MGVVRGGCGAAATDEEKAGPFGKLRASSSITRSALIIQRVIFRFPVPARARHFCSSICGNLWNPRMGYGHLE